jgi:hypothetical protein
LTYCNGHILLKPSFSPENPKQVDAWLNIVFDFLKMFLMHREMCVVTWHRADHIFPTEMINNISRMEMDELVETDLCYYNTKISESFMMTLSKSPQFVYSELALTPAPMIKDALKLQGSLKHQVLKNVPKLAGEYICFTNDGTSLCWLNTNLAFEKLKPILNKHDSKIIVAQHTF